jgi:hypothetical protein
MSFFAMARAALSLSSGVMSYSLLENTPDLFNGRCLRCTPPREGGGFRRQKFNGELADSF